MICFLFFLQANVRSLCAQNLFQVLDAKIKNECYSSQYACPDLEVAIVGSGPCGLRYAIETQLLGGRATVIEKRTSFTRNNVLHLWPFVIEDLKMLGTKQFFPKFCTGSMNHISKLSFSHVHQFEKKKNALINSFFRYQKNSKHLVKSLTCAWSPSLSWS